MAEVELSPGGRYYPYASIEPPRLGREVFRPLVPVRLALHQPSALLALVDSGSEHTLAPRWLAEALDIEFGADSDRLLLGVGGQAVEAFFARVDLSLYRDHDADDYIRWRADVGFLARWDVEFFLILGQIGFYDQFTVTMNRRLLSVHVGGVETFPMETPRSPAGVGLPGELG